MHIYNHFEICYFGENLETLNNFKLQKRAIRLVANNSSITGCKPYLKKLEIMTLTCTYIYEILLFTKIFLCRCKTHSMFHSYGVILFKQSTAYNSMLIQNKLSNEIKSPKSIIKFKKVLINFLLSSKLYINIFSNVITD